MNRNRPWVAGRLLALLAAMSLAAAGCGSRLPPEAPRSPTSPGATEPATTDTPSLEADVSINQSDYTFSPARFTIASGETLGIQNVSGRTPHTFTIEGEGIDLVNQPGQTVVVPIGLKPGKYSFMCRFHATGGMLGEVTVT